VGRHNALDKLIGWSLQSGRLPLSDAVVMVSGRASFEIMQKCLMAGAPIVCAVSAPSSLAADVARSFGMTLVGFLRGGRFNVYTGADRVLPSSNGR
jgi:FdhD protein